MSKVQLAMVWGALLAVGAVGVLLGWGWWTQAAQGAVTVAVIAYLLGRHHERMLCMRAIGAWRARAFADWAEQILALPEEELPPGLVEQREAIQAALREAHAYLAR